MSDSSIEIYSPVIPKQANCKNCHDCINACPVKAVQNALGRVIVDRAKCVQYVFKEEECLECIMACKSMALSLKVFLINDEGKIKQKQDEISS